MSNRPHVIFFLAAVAGGMVAGPAISRQSPADRPTLDCTYSSRAEGDVALFHHCARKGANGRLRIARHHLQRLAYDRHGLSNIFIDQWYVVRRDGALAPVMIMDNWPEGFSNGLARSPVGKKIGYIDRSLKLVVPARYDGAFPFEHGTARVCIGCTVQMAGEHSSYAGGRWSCIDRHGRRLEPLQHSEGPDITCPAAR